MDLACWASAAGTYTITADVKLFSATGVEPNCFKATSPTDCPRAALIYTSATGEKGNFITGELTTKTPNEYNQLTGTFVIDETDMLDNPTSMLFSISNPELPLEIHVRNVVITKQA
mmetsp:Transcript_42793/g.105481  ORF Transcript_42793/g.105481 Transcript_42793/m.105481 type:complete len:116 (+) Transcript_42793:1091-1438(+)